MTHDIHDDYDYYDPHGLHDIHGHDEESFLRYWSERVWDRAQLAQMAVIEAAMVDYAMTAWRPMSVDPPLDVGLLTACDEGVLIMRKTRLGDWRTQQGGVPHHAPRAWMPCPSPPPLNGR